MRTIHKIIRANHTHLDGILYVLDSATRNLLEKGIQQWDYPWDEEIINEEILNNQAYVILDEEKVAGVFFIKTIESGEHPPIMKEGHLYLYRIAVRPDYQSQGVGEEACGAAFTIAKKANRIIYLDCWEGNTKLKEFYSNTGFNYCGDFPENDYWISVFKFEPTINM
ncbi:MAG: GNAT family N-acetyltransferase [Clostridia bacterium]|nr:GNAT family N-acetyltransferase [Clostridia bacterium]